MKEITMQVNGYTGNAEVKWIEDKWSTPHWAAFITVPFKDGKWVNLFVYDQAAEEEAIEKAKEYLEAALIRCTMI